MKPTAKIWLCLLQQCRGRNFRPRCYRLCRLRRLQVLSLVFLALPSLAADWPQWGGANRDFQVTSPALANSWGKDGPRKIWQRALGPGLSAVVAVDGRLFTLWSEGEKETIGSFHAQTGELLWHYSYPAKLHSQHDRSYYQGPNSTPAVIHNRVIAIGFTGRLHALDAASGKLRWSYDLLADFSAQRLRFGHAPSPLIHNDSVVVLVGGERTGAIALDPLSGAVLWQTAPLDISYASPIVARFDGADQIIFLSSEEILAVTAGSGRLSWRAPCRNGFANNASDPIWLSDRLLWVASQTGCGARVLSLAHANGQISARPLWANPDLSVHYWNAIRIDKTIYTSVGPEGRELAAIDIQTGKIHWQRDVQAAKAKLILADGKLIMLAESGDLVLAKVSPQRFQALARFSLVDEPARTVPTLVDGKLFVRGKDNLQALDLSLAGNPSMP